MTRRRILPICVSFLAGGAATTLAGWIGLADLAPRRGEATRLDLASAAIHLRLTVWHPGSSSPTEPADCEAIR